MVRIKWSAIYEAVIFSVSMNIYWGPAVGEACSRCWESSGKEERLDSLSPGADSFVEKTDHKQIINVTTSNGDKCATKKMKQPNLIESY